MKRSETSEVSKQKRPVASTGRFVFSGNGGVGPDLDGKPPHTPILPPPFLVIATTEGRTGISGLKSGQRVERSS